MRGQQVVVVIGAGAAGVAVAAHLLGGRSGPRVVLVDPRRDDGRGVAYSTGDACHLLNVPSGKMSARDNDPDDFVRWLATHVPDAAAGTFAPRREFGRYLAEHLRRARRADRDLERVHDHVTGIVPDGGGMNVSLHASPPVRADAVVLATGVLPPGTAWAPRELRASGRFVADPWAAGALDGVGDGDVLLVGTGLTMVDVATTLARPGRTVHAVSRSGRLPRRHARHPQPPRAPDPLPTGDLDALRDAVRRHVTDTVRERGDWRPAWDGLRPHTQALWASLPDGDRARFLDEDVRTWDTHRHRMAPAVADRLAGLRRDGRVRVSAGEVRRVTEHARGLDVELADGRCLRVTTVVNCTGPGTDRDGLAGRLLHAGQARPGPRDIGYDTTADGRVVDDGGSAHAPLWTLGATRRGSLWESTAFPEIRAQAAAVAADVRRAGTAPAPARRPRDRYGLPLSTTADVAALHDVALGRILDVRSGAEQAVRDVVAADPGFAVGHAALAVFAHEADRPAEAARHLARAVAARGDDRERGFVGAVAGMLDGCDPSALLRHLDAWPRDALAASIAVPTIAFSGVSAGQDSWELVERLGPAYGDDPWYLAQLAFVRQDQSRWDEAEALSVRALAEAPACGHAVHARTHVFYETGAHEAGLSWLDGWLAEHGPAANHRAHFSWHAALHELALCDDDAVRRRYAAQLAPPLVTGPRALVDSASLLWRCRMTRGWDADDGAIAPVLASVPREWTRRPPTGFAALHVALALAAGGDTAGLHRLRRYASGRGLPCFGGVVAPLCAAFADVVDGRWGRAADRLTAVMPRLAECGGSAAQREVVEDTLIHSLMTAGRHTDAAAVLNGRLDRRPSRLDSDRLVALAG